MQIKTSELKKMKIMQNQLKGITKNEAESHSKQTTKLK